MPLKEIHAVTAAGEDELRSSATKLSAAEIELLVRMDGVLALGEIRQAMAGVSGDAFMEAFRSLRDKRLVSVTEQDPFAIQCQADLQKLALSIGSAQADTGLSSLRRSGYYVQIARERKGRRAQASDRPRSAVVVEDEPSLARFIQSYLALEGFQCEVAGNRAQILARFRRHPIPDLILLDVMLPDANGFDVLLQLRQHPAYQAVPVIMLTGKASREAVITGLAAGADGYITKPFEPEALTRAVQTVLGLAALEEPAAVDVWMNRDARQGREAYRPQANG